MSVKKMALYCRVSTNHQSSGLEAQRRALHAYCRDRNIEDAVVYEDEGISGAKTSRPALDRLMDDAQRGKIDTVVVYSFSRFARSTRHLLDALAEFERYRVAFVSITESIDTGSALGKCLFTIISAISQLERELISERVRNGLSNARAKGRVGGRPRNRNSRLIRELSSQGYSCRRIAELAACSPATVVRELAATSNVSFPGN